MKVTKAREIKRYVAIAAIAGVVFSVLAMFVQQVSAQSSGRKEIRNPAEYHAYMKALAQPDVKAKIGEMESFLSQYPDSVMKEDALEIVMDSYERTADSAKALDAGHELLTVNPCNLRALALLTWASRRGKNPDEAKRFGAKGNLCLQTATKPSGMSDDAWNVFKKSLAGIFNNDAGGTIGIIGGVSPRSSQ
jgi:hypothetical protein